MSMAVPVMLLANPDERSKAKKKKATGGTKMAKKRGKRDAHGRFVATKKAKTNPAAKSGSKKPRRRKPRRNAAANPAPRKRSYARRSSPKHKRKHPRRRNSGGTSGGPSKGKVAAQVAAGVLIGGVAAGGAEYAMAGSEMLATPGRRAAVHGVLALASGVASVMVPKAAPLLATIAGSFAGNVGTNGVKAIASGSAAPSAQKAATPAVAGGAPGQMTGGVIAPRGMRGAVVRQLPAGAPMRGGVLSLAQMRGLVQR